ncbi:PAAR domain-containing protein [Burkholderia ambifaria]|uniref:PAAR domain-containing protein n=1 Tax=Burkholderia ambifaria TaxID=152480 RepID=UPI00398215AF
MKGDTTTVGGIVQGGDGQDILHDREQAYEHDPVWCPVCKTVGVIECDGDVTQALGRMVDSRRSWI